MAGRLGLELGLSSKETTQGPSTNHSAKGAHPYNIKGEDSAESGVLVRSTSYYSPMINARGQGARIPLSKTSGVRRYSRPVANVALQDRTSVFKWLVMAGLHTSNVFLLSKWSLLGHDVWSRLWRRGEKPITNFYNFSISELAMYEKIRKDDNQGTMAPCPY